MNNIKNKNNKTIKQLNKKKYTIACVLFQLIMSLLFMSQVYILIKSAPSDPSKLLISLDESEAVESPAKRSWNDFRSNVSVVI